MEFLATCAADELLYFARPVHGRHGHEDALVKLLQLVPYTIVVALFDQSSLIANPQVGHDIVEERLGLIATREVDLASTSSFGRIGTYTAAVAVSTLTMSLPRTGRMLLRRVRVQSLNVQMVATH